MVAGPAREETRWPSVRQIPDESLAYKERIAAFRSLPSELAPADRDALVALLIRVAPQDDGPWGASLKNEIMNQLCTWDPPGLRELLTAIYEDRNQSAVSHTKNVAITLRVTVSVCPSQIVYDLKGDGGEGYVTFETNGVAASGGDQSHTITANGPLPNQIGILSKSITWTIKVGNASCTDSSSSGPHKIYVTYGTPAGSAVTEIRLSDVCTAADGQSTLGGCASTISTHLGGFRYDPYGKLNGPSPIWLLHEGGTNTSQCPGLALFINRHFQMLGLGVNGVTRYCQAWRDGHYYAFDSGTPCLRLCTPGQNGHPDPTTHDDISSSEPLAHRDGSGYLNNYEAACLFNAKYYAVGVGIYSTSKEVVINSFPSPGAINWFYGTSIEPPPFGTWSGCDITPWIEVP